MEVSTRFSTFLNNITLSPEQISVGTGNWKGVCGCLNRHYWNSVSDTDHSRLIGSWGKETRVRPPRDVDLLFQLPIAVYERFQQREGNKQSQLLQEVKRVLENTYPRTDMRGDGQVVIVRFSTFSVEVVPAILLQSNAYWICDTNGGGRYKVSDPEAERQLIARADSACGTTHNARNLIRAMKRWQEECNVPLKSFCIELLVADFITTYEHRDKSLTWFDLTVRDFLTWLCNRAHATLIVPGSQEAINIGSDWHSRAITARDRAIYACQYEAAKDPAAGPEWQKIFGTYIPGN